VVRPILKVIYIRTCIINVQVDFTFVNNYQYSIS